MPEIKHHFRAGRMNKDLDERLVPNGEYRDAQNIEINTSEGSDVGSVQNVVGTTLKDIKTYNNSTAATTAWDVASNSIKDLTSPQCIGSIADTQNNKIYWFIAATGASAIAEYDEATGVVTPVLVDKNSILNFSTDYPITGINVLGSSEGNISDFLLWTDNQTEPKKINIRIFKSGCTNFNTHTQFTSDLITGTVGTGNDFTEDDITTIKLGPLKAPKLAMFSSKRGGIGTEGGDKLHAKKDFSGFPSNKIRAGQKFEGDGNKKSFTLLSDYFQTEIENLNKDKLEVFIDGEEQINTPTTIWSYSYSSTTGGVVTFSPTTTSGAPAVGSIIIIREKIDKQEDLTLLPDIGVSFGDKSVFDYRKNDIITLTYKEGGDVYEIKAKVIDDNPISPLNVEIQSIPFEVPNRAVEWEIVLDEADPLFEEKFVRFGYRWKYKDGEYSTFSPFTEVAFLPSEFKYKSSNGYNIGMGNTLRRLIIHSLDTQPDNVDEVDILYKESNSTNVYVVDTIKERTTTVTGFPALSYEISSEIIGATVPSNQLLRPWDNVPKKALSQEVTANRLIYGNYKQQYTILKQNTPDVAISIKNNDILTVKKPEKSIKTQRTYQAGVVYKDLYGRETPVFSNNNASMKLGKSFADNVNKLECQLLNNPPSFATHCKYYIKEPSNEYYNLALDRFYPAEDGNVWLSFPSSERNKLTEESYLILKKQHNSDEPVEVDAKYKVLDIKNEPPKFITLQTSSKGSALCRILKSGNNAPGVGVSSFKFRGPEATQNPTFASGFNSDGVLSITTSSGTTNKYRIVSGGLTGEVELVGSGGAKHVYTVTLEEGFKDTEAEILKSANTNSEDEFTIVLHEEKEILKPEYEGRFFVKINRDAVFDTNIVSSFTSSDIEYSITNSRRVDANSVNIPENDGDPPYYGHPWQNLQGIAWEDKDNVDIVVKNPTNHSDSETHHKKERGSFNAGALDYPGDQYDSTNNEPEKQTFSLFWSGVDYGDSWSKSSMSKGKVENGVIEEGKGKKGVLHNKGADINPLLEQLIEVGTRFQFRNDNGDKSLVYEVLNGEKDFQYRYQGDWGDVKEHLDRIYGKRIEYKIKFKRADGLDTTGWAETGGKFDHTNSAKVISRVDIVKKDLKIGNTTISSKNPAIFETEPLETAELDLYYEASNAIPIIKPSMKIKEKSGGTSIISANSTIKSVNKPNKTTDILEFTINQNLAGAVTAASPIELTITSSDNVHSFNVTTSGAIASGQKVIKIDGGQVHGQKHQLSWFNCYSFGNGVESNRINDDFNAMFIDKGPRVSSTLSEQYKEEHKPNGLIFSGLFNSTSGINRLNQFIQAESITKDINPQYGSIQKLHTRDNDLIALCEDKILNIPANKDLLFNADGSANLTASNKVLGVAAPYPGEYGISKNPESFISHAYRAYFADKSRGAVLRLSRNGLTNIAANGMTDWFKDNLATSTTLLGTYNENKGSYNLTLKGTSDYTASFDERVNGWTSFKSFIPESGLSLNNKYYTFKNGDLYLHNNSLRNCFYGTIAKVNGNVSNSTSVTLDSSNSNIAVGQIVKGTGITVDTVTVASISGTALVLSSAQTISDDVILSFYNTYESSINVVLNDSPSFIKGFKTLNYEGTKSRKYTYDHDTPANTTFAKGWYCNSITTNEQTGDVKEFVDKEGIWYNYLIGDTTVHTAADGSTTSSNLDTQEFSVQGIGQFASISGDTSIGGFDLSITISDITGMSVESVSGGSWVLETGSNKIVYLNVATGTDIGNTSNIANPILTFKADSGYSLPGSQTISSQSPSSSVSAIGSGSTWSSGVLTLDLSAHTLAADRNITVTLGTAATVTSYTLSGSYQVNAENAYVSAGTYSTEGTYSSSGSYEATSTPTFTDSATSSTWNKVFTADSGYHFATTPTCDIDTQDNDIESYYTITSANTTTDSNGNVTAVTFTITYKHGAKNITNDVLVFNAKAIKIPATVVAEADKITGFTLEDWNFENEKTIISGLQSKELTHRITGPPDATFRLARRLITTVGGTATTNDWYYYNDTETEVGEGNAYDHTGYELSPFDLTIPSGGVYLYKELYPIISSVDSKQFEYEVQPVNPGSLSSTFVDTNPASVYQYNKVCLTLLTASGNRLSTTGVATASSGSFTVTATGDTTSEKKYSVTPYAQQCGRPKSFVGEDAAGNFVPFTIIYSHDGGVDADRGALGFKNLRDPIPGLDFRNAFVQGRVSATTEDSTTAILYSTNNAIYASNGDGKLDPRTGGGDKTDIGLSSFPGMKVRDAYADADGNYQIKTADNEDYVTVAGWNYLTKTVTFSSPQSLAKDTLLYFEQPDGWRIGMQNVSGALTAPASGNTWKGVYTLTGSVGVHSFGTSHRTMMLNMDRFLFDSNKAIQIDAADRPQSELKVTNDGYKDSTAAAAAVSGTATFNLRYLSVIENRLLTLGANDAGAYATDLATYENVTKNSSEVADGDGDAAQQLKNVYVKGYIYYNAEGLTKEDITLSYYTPIDTLYDPTDTTTGYPIHSITGPSNPSFGPSYHNYPSSAIPKTGKKYQYVEIGPIQINFNNTIGNDDNDWHTIQDKINFGIRYSTG